MTNTQTLKQASPWFKQWFDSEYYHKLYANRDEEEAKNFINALLKKLRPWNDSSIIDVGCGAGRHAKYLASKGFDVTGIDTAYTSIQQANESKSEALRFIQHDMRELFGENGFDYVFNFFTSFGYFNNNYENYAVIENMAKALKPHGALVIDYLNVPYAEEHLVAAEEKEIDGVEYSISRWNDARHFYKKIIINNHTDEPFEFIEKVAKLKASDFSNMLYLAKMKIKDIYGDYLLNEYNRTSPRLIMIARKY